MPRKTYDGRNGRYRPDNQRTDWSGLLAELRAPQRPPQATTRYDPPRRSA